MLIWMRRLFIEEPTHALDGFQHNRSCLKGKPWKRRCVKTFAKGCSRQGDIIGSSYTDVGGVVAQSVWRNAYSALHF